MQETRVWSLGQEDTLEKGMKTHSSVLDWKIPFTEEPGGLQSMAGGKRVRHKWVTKQQRYIHKFWSIFYSTLLPTYMIDWSPQMDNRSKKVIIETKVKQYIHWLYYVFKNCVFKKISDFSLLNDIQRMI